ncbi:hypothetical protein ASD31_00245 [Rhizobium sp. Root482]|nr:hypothetical protein ASD31_00245 [Rhizobium sp. Root482]
MFALSISIIGTITLSVLLISIMRRAAVHLALIDHPDARKQHEGVIPLCGGVCIFSVFTASLFFSGAHDVLDAVAWIGLAVIVIVGMVDDMHALPARLRLSLQFAAAALLINALPLSTISFGTLFPADIGPVPVVFVFAIVFVSGSINAWNMLDGVDGLAGGSAAMALPWLMLFAAEAGDGTLIFPIEMLMAAIFGFLFFNMRSPFRKRASVFLGDAGSTALGATIAYLILRLSCGPNAIAFPVLAWIIIVPVIDTLSLMVRRTWARRSPMSADRWHMHHLLLDQGFSPAHTTLIILAASTLCGGWGYIGHDLGISDTVMTIGLLMPVAVHTAFVALVSGTMNGQSPTLARIAQIQTFDVGPISDAGSNAPAKPMLVASDMSASVVSLTSLPVVAPPTRAAGSQTGLGRGWL